MQINFEFTCYSDFASGYFESVCHLKNTIIGISADCITNPCAISEFYFSASLSWKLHFEFVTTTTKLDDRVPPKSTKNNTTWTGPQHLDIETMVWDLPITIVPCNPIQVYFGLQLKNSIDMNIWYYFVAWESHPSFQRLPSLKFETANSFLLAIKFLHLWIKIRIHQLKGIPSWFEYMAWCLQKENCAF